MHAIFEEDHLFIQQQAFSDMRVWGWGVQNMPGIQTWLLTNPEGPSLQFSAYVAQMSKASSSHECSKVQPQQP